MKIFLIDDDEASRRAVEMQLKQAIPDIEVESFAQLREGLGHLNAGNPDAVILDLNLDDSNEELTIARIPVIAMKVPVVVMSGSDRKELIQRAMAAGAQDFVVKSELAENPRMLLQAITRAVDRFRVAGQLKATSVRDALLQEGRPLTPDTTMEEDRVSYGQRRVNLIWEGNQAVIALVVIVTGMYTSASLALRMDPTADGKSISITAFLLISNTVFLVIGFYFGRTNHQKIGGVVQGR